MNEISLRALMVSLALALSSCEKPVVPTIPAVALINLETRDADARTIKAIEVDSAKSLEARDAVKFAAMYAPDATLYLSGLPVIRGSQAIRKVFEAAAKDPGFTSSFETTSVQVAGDLATTEGTYRQTKTDSKTKKIVTEKGHYFTLWRKQPGGAWKAITDTTAAEPAAK